MPGRHSQARREGQELGPSRKGRKSLGDMRLQEVFERQDPAEKAAISRGYRAMQAKADGECPLYE